LTKAKLKSGEKPIQQLRVLQGDAGERLEQEFRVLLERVSRPIEPLSLYNEEKNTFDDPPKIDPEAMSHLKKISTFLQESPAFKGDSEHSEIYIDVRLTYLRKSFEPLARENVALDRLKKRQQPRSADFYEKGSHHFLFYSFSLLVMLNVRALFPFSFSPNYQS